MRRACTWEISHHGASRWRPDGSEQRDTHSTMDLNQQNGGFTDEPGVVGVAELCARLSEHLASCMRSLFRRVPVDEGHSWRLQDECS